MSAATTPANENGAAPLVCITRYPAYAKRQPQGRRVSGTVEKFFEEFSVPEIVADKEAASGWSPVTFANDYRNLKNVEPVALVMLGLDYDKGRTTVADASRLWGHRAGFVHSTWSSTPEVPRLRVFLLLSRLVSGDEHALLLRCASDQSIDAGHPVDESTKDASRFWFVPSCPPGGTFVCARLTGAPIDVDTVLAQLKANEAVAVTERDKVKAEASRAKPLRQTEMRAAWWASIQAPERVRRAKAWLGTIPGGVGYGSGDGEKDMLRVATAIVRGFAVPTADAFALISTDYAPRCAPPWTDPKEIHHKISEAFDEGALAFGDKLGPKPADPSPITPRPTMAERARKIGGARVRIATGFPTLDRCMRGGLLLGKILVAGGAPDGCKTTLVKDAGIHAARAGHQVIVLTFDEEADDVLVRVGQGVGIPREQLEMGEAGARAVLETHLLTMPNFEVIDGDEDHVTIEQAAEILAERAPDGGVLIIDSIQTAIAAGVREAKTKKDRVDAVMASLKFVRKRYGHAVFATCELARGAYRSKNAAEQSEDIASFKESGDIEYLAQVALVLRSVKGSAGLVEATFGKNKLGRKEPFRLAFDFTTARLSEVDMPEADGAGESSMSSDVEDDAEVIRTILREHPAIAGKGALRAQILALGIKMSKDRSDAALVHMKSEIEDRPEKGKPRWFLREEEVTS